MKNTFNKKLLKVTLSHVLKNYFHIGDKARFWHPSMNAYVLGSIDVIPMKKRIQKKSKRFVGGRSKVQALEALKGKVH